jgi:hypothetical protein
VKDVKVIHGIFGVVVVLDDRDAEGVDHQRAGELFFCSQTYDACDACTVAPATRLAMVLRVRMRVRACFQRVQFGVVRCNSEGADVQGFSVAAVSCGLLVRTRGPRFKSGRPDWNPLNGSAQ